VNSRFDVTDILQVPSSFNAQQRRAIAGAATIAGLPVLQVIDEATAGMPTCRHACVSRSWVSLAYFSLSLC
jgi:ABC-type branched-subunit amino acid transport system ATPase component